MTNATASGSPAAFDEPIRVLVVEDHEHILWGLAKLIQGEWPRMVLTGMARTVSEALAALERRAADVVVVDSRFAGDSTLPSLLRRGARAVVFEDEPAEVLLEEIERAYYARIAGAA